MPIVPEEETKTLLKKHKEMEDRQKDTIRKRARDQQRACFLCTIVVCLIAPIVASFKAIQAASQSGSLWELNTRAATAPVVYLAAHENHVQVLEGKVADFSGVWWWRKTKELTATQIPPFFRPTGSELGLSFAIPMYPANVSNQMVVNLNSKHHTFYKKAWFFQWLLKWFTFSFFDGTHMREPLEEEPLGRVSLDFPISNSTNSSILNYCKVTNIDRLDTDRLDTFYLVKLDDDQWLQTSAVPEGFEIVGSPEDWAKALPKDGVATSGYVLTRVIHGGSGVQHKNFWALFSEEEGDMTKIVSWDTDDWNLRYWSQFFSWVPKFSKLPCFREPPAPSSTSEDSA